MLAWFWQTYKWEKRMRFLKQKIKELETNEIIRALEESEWIMARAARKLGITERMIGYKIRKYGIKKEVIKGAERIRW